MSRFAELGPGARLALARNAREYAESELGIERMVDGYEALLAALTGARKV